MRLSSSEGQKAMRHMRHLIVATRLIMEECDRAKHGHQPGDGWTHTDQIHKIATNVLCAIGVLDEQEDAA
jgi:hypothetical protein